MSERTLVAIHGNFASARWWTDLINDPPAGWRVVAPDLPGFAGTENNGEVSIPAYAQWLGRWLTEQHIVRPALLGHSLGWAEDAGIAHVDSWLMRVWDGQSWQAKVSAVRRNLSDAGRSRSFDVMKNGVPTLLWTDLAVPGAWAASVRPLRWDGKTWLPDAVLSDIKFAGFAPDVRVGPGGLRTVIFLEGNYASMNVVVMRETLPDRWERLRPPLNRTPGSFTTQPRLNLTPFGQPVVAWIEGGDDDPDRVFVSRWNGRAWQRLGGDLSAGNEMAETLALALGHDGQPRAAWLADGKLRAAQWTGSHWEALTLPGTRNVTGVSLSEDGEFLAASVNGKLHLWNWP